MKVKNPPLIAFVSVMICAIVVFGFLEIHYRPVVLRHSRQNPIAEHNNDGSVSISKSTILLLLAVGIAGALGVRRKEKNRRSPAQHNRLRTTSDDRNKAFIMLNKQYLNLQYNITRHKFSGARPPDGLLKELSDLERKVRLIARALE